MRAAATTVGPKTLRKRDSGQMVVKTSQMVVKYGSNGGPEDLVEALRPPGEAGRQRPHVQARPEAQARPAAAAAAGEAGGVAGGDEALGEEGHGGEGGAAAVGGRVGVAGPDVDGDDDVVGPHVLGLGAVG